MNSFKEQRRETLYSLLPVEQGPHGANFADCFEAVSAFVEQEVAAAFRRGLRAKQGGKFRPQTREVRSALRNGRLEPKERRT